MACVERNQTLHTTNQQCPLYAKYILRQPHCRLVKYHETNIPNMRHYEFVPLELSNLPAAHSLNLFNLFIYISKHYAFYQPSGIKVHTLNPAAIKFTLHLILQEIQEFNMVP